MPRAIRFIARLLAHMVRDTIIESQPDTITPQTTPAIAPLSASTPRCHADESQTYEDEKRQAMLAATPASLQGSVQELLAATREERHHARYEMPLPECRRAT